MKYSDRSRRGRSAARDAQSVTFWKSDPETNAVTQAIHPMERIVNPAIISFSFMPRNMVNGSSPAADFLGHVAVGDEGEEPRFLGFRQDSGNHRRLDILAKGMVNATFVRTPAHGTMKTVR